MRHGVSCAVDVLVFLSQESKTNTHTHTRTERVMLWIREERGVEISLVAMSRLSEWDSTAKCRVL